jgi:hypothetical protein
MPLPPPREAEVIYVARRLPRAEYGEGRKIVRRGLALERVDQEERKKNKCSGWY